MPRQPSALIIESNRLAIPKRHPRTLRLYSCPPISRPSTIRTRGRCSQRLAALPPALMAPRAPTLTNEGSAGAVPRTVASESQSPPITLFQPHPRYFPAGSHLGTRSPSLQLVEINPSAPPPAMPPSSNEEKLRRANERYREMLKKQDLRMKALENRILQLHALVPAGTAGDPIVL